MLEFSRYRSKEISFAALIAALSPVDLGPLTNEMVDTVLAQITGCMDEDVVFVPQDPQAHDPYAEDPVEVDMAWTLGHVIVHITASAEESAFLAAEMARGVKLHGRSRYEIPWREITTIEQCRQRLEESRRMRLASLEVWPDPAHFDIVQRIPWLGKEPINAVGRFVLGLSHDDSHRGQIEDIVRQAAAARR